MCSVCVVQLLSLSHTPTLPYAALYLWDSASPLPSWPAAFLLGSASPVRGAGWGGCRLAGRQGLVRSSLHPASGSPTAAVTLELTVAPASRFQHFS